MRDITARKQAEDALRKPNDELERRVAEQAGLERANQELERFAYRYPRPLGAAEGCQRLLVDPAGGL